MKGIEIARKYFLEFGKPMLEKDFADIIDLLAVGYVGSGSERYGFDDEISHDHDYEAGFSIFLPNENLIDSRKEFALERAYYKLPKEFMGFTRQSVLPVGGNRNGPIRIADFYKDKVGNENGDLSVSEWLSIPDYFLSEATNGEVFFDNLGQFTKIRNKLKNMPEDIRLKRLAGNLLMMSQTGQYNFMRCVKHGEIEAGKLALNEFVSSAIKTVFYLNKKYAPYYKWSFRALRDLENGNSYAEELSSILLSPLSNQREIEETYLKVEKFCSLIIDKIKDAKLSKADCGDFSKHAYSVNDLIESNEIRNLNILASV